MHCSMASRWRVDAENGMADNESRVAENRVHFLLWPPPVLGGRNVMKFNNARTIIYIYNIVVF